VKNSFDGFGYNFLIKNVLAHKCWIGFCQ